MSTALFLIILTGVLAGLGRSATPKRERLPWLRWTMPDLVTNVARGARSLVEPTPRQRHLMETKLSGLKPR